MGIPNFHVKLIKNFGNSHAFFTLATKKGLIFLAIPNKKCG